MFLYVFLHHLFAPFPSKTFKNAFLDENFNIHHVPSIVNRHFVFVLNATMIEMIELIKFVDMWYNYEYIQFQA